MANIVRDISGVAELKPTTRKAFSTALEATLDMFRKRSGVPQKTQLKILEALGQLGGAVKCHLIDATKAGVFQVRRRAIEMLLPHLSDDELFGMTHLLEDQSQEPIKTFLEALLDRDRNRAAMFISTLSMARKIMGGLLLLPDTFHNDNDAAARILLTTMRELLVQQAAKDNDYSSREKGGAPGLGREVARRRDPPLLAQREVQDDRWEPRTAGDSGVGRELERRRDPRHCLPSGPSRMTITIPVPPRFGRWPRSGPTTRRAARSPSGPPRMTTTTPAASRFGAGREVARRRDAAHCSPSGSSRIAPRCSARRAFGRWPRSGPTTRRAHCSPSGPSRIRTIMCGAWLFPRWANALPVWPNPARRETWMAPGRISIRSDRFHVITSNRQPRRPPSIPRISTAGRVALGPPGMGCHLRAKPPGQE